jgi:hypothetical protein
MLKIITTLLTVLNYRPWYSDNNYTHYTCINTVSRINSNTFSNLYIQDPILYNCIKENVVHNKKDGITANLRGSTDTQINLFFKDNSLSVETFIVKIKSNKYNFSDVEKICDKYKIKCDLIGT